MYYYFQLLYKISTIGQSIVTSEALADNITIIIIICKGRNWKNVYNYYDDKYRKEKKLC